MCSSSILVCLLWRGYYQFVWRLLYIDVTVSIRTTILYWSCRLRPSVWTFITIDEHCRRYRDRGIWTQASMDVWIQLNESINNKMIRYTILEKMTTSLWLQCRQIKIERRIMLCWIGGKIIYIQRKRTVDAVLCSTSCFYSDSSFFLLLLLLHYFCHGTEHSSDRSIRN